MAASAAVAALPQTIRWSIHPSRPRDKRCLPTASLPPPHAKLPQHSHIFPWRQRGGRPTQAGRYHCNVIPPLGLIVHRQRGTSTNRQYSLSVYPSSPPSIQFPSSNPTSPMRFMTFNRLGIRNVCRRGSCVCPCSFYQTDRQTAFQELAGPNLDL